MNRVFLSSTCYDLIDLRAELATFIKSLGFDPVLSENDFDSAFELSGDPESTSISQCIYNVRKSDCLLLIISQRYGASLINTSHRIDISATQLEYEEFMKQNHESDTKKPIHVFVRNKLLNEYEIWRKNKNETIKYPWVKEADKKVFQFLDHVTSHPKPTDTSKNNWYTPFRDSVDLKEKVQTVLKSFSPNAIVERLIREHRMATILPTSVSALQNRTDLSIISNDSLNRSGNSIHLNSICEIGFSLLIHNVGDVPAFNVANTAKAIADIEGLDATCNDVKALCIEPFKNENRIYFRIQFLHTQVLLVRLRTDGTVPIELLLYSHFWLPTGEVITDECKLLVLIKLHNERHIIVSISDHIEFCKKSFIKYSPLSSPS
jgi:Domain of unknown function (DUF4062)